MLSSFYCVRSGNLKPRIEVYSLLWFRGCSLARRRLYFIFIFDYCCVSVTTHYPRVIHQIGTIHSIIFSVFLLHCSYFWFCFEVELCSGMLHKLQQYNRDIFSNISQLLILDQMFLASCGSHLSPHSISFFLSQNNSECSQTEFSQLGPSTMAPTGHASWQNPQQMHLVMSMSQRVVRREPSGRGSDSMVIALAGQAMAHSLHAIHLSQPITHLSSPEGYLRKACYPRNIGERGPFSYGYIMVHSGSKVKIRALKYVGQNSQGYTVYQYIMSQTSEKSGSKVLSFLEQRRTIYGPQHQYRQSGLQKCLFLNYYGALLMNSFLSISTDNSTYGARSALPIHTFSDSLGQSQHIQYNNIQMQQYKYFLQLVTLRRQDSLTRSLPPSYFLIPTLLFTSIILALFDVSTNAQYFIAGILLPLYYERGGVRPQNWVIALVCILLLRLLTPRLQSFDSLVLLTLWHPTVGIMGWILNLFQQKQTAVKTDTIVYK